MATSLSVCLACGALVADVDGPVHTYLPSSAGCWRVFGQVQAEELARFGYRQLIGWSWTRTWLSIPATAGIGVTASRCSCTSSPCAPCSRAMWHRRV